MARIDDRVLEFAATRNLLLCERYSGESTRLAALVFLPRGIKNYLIKYSKQMIGTYNVEFMAVSIPLRLLNISRGKDKRENSFFVKGFTFE